MGSPTDAAQPAQDDAALPVEEQLMVAAPASSAIAVATADARSLSEAVGLTPSSLMNTPESPISCASLLAA